MNPALETLLLAFQGDDALPIPPRALFLGAEPHPTFSHWPSIVGWQPHRPLADKWDRSGLSRIASPSTEKWPLVMILPGKSTSETLAWFAAAKDALEPGGSLLAALPNTAGAVRFEKHLAQAAGRITSIQKHKCRAFHATLDHADEATFDAWRAGGAMRIVSGFHVQAGLFSVDHVDPGSQLLVDHLPHDLQGHVADLGAGWGFLAHAVLKNSPAVSQIDLFETDSRALDCARLNLVGSETKTNFHWHDVTSGLPATYDAIVMNPPFHAGQARHVDLGRAFLDVAIRSLKPPGRLFLVANKQLPYETILASSGLEWRKVTEDRTYKILFAKHPA